MARPLRRDIRDGWCHVFHRGTERGVIFRDTRDREHFLELLEETTVQVLTRGSEVATLERLADGVGIGEAAFVALLKQAVGRASRETTGKRALRRRVGLEEVLRAVATVRGEAWEHCGNRRGDWGRPLAMWAARRYAGMSLREIGAPLGGRDYGAVSMAIQRFEAQAAHSRTLAEARRKLARMLNVKT